MRSWIKARTSERSVSRVDAVRKASTIVRTSIGERHVRMAGKAAGVMAFMGAEHNEATVADSTRSSQGSGNASCPRDVSTDKQYTPYLAMR